MLLLLAAIWLGLFFANRLVRPIGSLIDAAERVRSGDLRVRVAETGDDELANLSKAFNRMTGQLDHNRQELVEANLQIDARRQFTETVLAGVSAGVVSAILWSLSSYLSAIGCLAFAVMSVARSGNMAPTLLLI